MGHLKRYAMPKFWPLPRKGKTWVVKPLPGQEASNTAYLTQKNAAIKVDDPKKIRSVIDGLLEDPTRLRKISESQSTISKPNASFDIAKLILGL